MAPKEIDGAEVAKHNSRENVGQAGSRVVAGSRRLTGPLVEEHRRGSVVR